MRIFELNLLSLWAVPVYGLKKQMWQKRRMFEALSFKGPNGSRGLVLWSFSHWRLKGLWLSGAGFLTLNRSPVFSGVTTEGKNKRKISNVKGECGIPLGQWQRCHHFLLCQGSMYISLKLTQGSKMGQFLILQMGGRCLSWMKIF